MRVYGREALINETVASLREGRSLVLSGAMPGVGLTTVCRQVLRRLTEAGDGAVVYLPQLRTEKPFWQEVCFQLGCAEEGAIYNSGGKGLNSNALAGLARGKIRSLGGVIMLLDCEAGLPADDSNTIKALLGLTSLGAVFLVATHGLGAGKQFLQRLGPVREVEGLSDEDAKAYVDYLTTDWSLDEAEPIKRMLVKKSRGLPGLLVQALAPYAATRRLTLEQTEALASPPGAPVRYMYLWVCVPLLFLMVFNRYLSRVVEGGGDRVSIVMGALGLVLSFFFARFGLPLLKKG